MSNLNRQWVILIGILFLSILAAIGWEIYSIYIFDARSEFVAVEQPFESNSLLPEDIIEHFEEVAN